MRHKILTFIEGTFVTGLFLSISAMDSPDVTVPGIGLIASAVGLLVTSRMEQKIAPSPTKAKRCY